MDFSTNSEVQKFLNEIEELAPEKFQTLQELRQIVHGIYPEVQERIIYGGIMFTLEDDFGGIFPSKKHVSFEFSQGYLLQDPEKRLEGKGKFRRHLKIKALEEVEEKQVEFFVRQVRLLKG